MLRAARNFVSDGCLDHSAIVAYYTLLSMGPFLYLVGRLLRSVLDVNDPTGIALGQITPFFPPEVAPFLQRLGQSLPANQGLAIAAFPVLLWLATTAFTALERAVNAAFVEKPSGRFWLPRLKAFVVASALTVLMAASLVVNQAAVWIERYRRRLSLPAVLGPRAAWVTYLLLLAVAFLTYTFIYKLLPRKKVRWSSVLQAAGVSLLLWEAARQLFSSLLSRSPAFGILTGTLAGIVALVVWIYTTVAICLLGSEITAVLNGNRGQGRSS